MEDRPSKRVTGTEFRFLEALDRLETRLRADIASTESRVTEAVHEVSRDLVEYARSHEKKHEAFEGIVRGAEVAKARRDGALGVFRFALEQANRNWRAVVAVAALLIGLLGNVHVTVGAGQ